MAPIFTIAGVISQIPLDDPASQTRFERGQQELHVESIVGQQGATGATIQIGGKQVGGRSIEFECRLIKWMFEPLGVLEHRPVIDLLSLGPIARDQHHESNGGRVYHPRVKPEQLWMVQGGDAAFWLTLPSRIEVVGFEEFQPFSSIGSTVAAFGRFSLATQPQIGDKWPELTLSAAKHR